MLKVQLYSERRRVMEQVQVLTDVVLAIDPELVLGRIREEDLSPVRAKILKEKALPEGIVDAAIEEYRKFMTLIALGKGNMAMCSREVDEVWHTHILFTRSYMKFCVRIFGKYIHHQPATAESPISPDSAVLFVQSYQEAFGQLHPLWSRGSIGRYKLDPARPEDWECCFEDPPPGPKPSGPKWEPEFSAELQSDWKLCGNPFNPDGGGAGSCCGGCGDDDCGSDDDDDD